MKKIFDVDEVPNNKQTKVVAFYLTGEANRWLGTIKRKHESRQSILSGMTLVHLTSIGRKIS